MLFMVWIDAYVLERLLSFLTFFMNFCNFLAMQSNEPIISYPHFSGFSGLFPGLTNFSTSGTWPKFDASLYSGNNAEKRRT